MGGPLDEGSSNPAFLCTAEETLAYYRAAELEKILGVGAPGMMLDAHEEIREGCPAARL